MSNPIDVSSPRAPGFTPDLGTPPNVTDQPPILFEYTGHLETYTVPAGAVAVRVCAWGASGGEGHQYCQAEPCPRSAGGRGGYAEATIAVTPNQVLTIKVGGAGGPVGAPSSGAGGWNGGGAGAKTITDGGNFFSGGGGGASSVLLDNQTVIVAGGGGGGSGQGPSGPPSWDAAGGNGGNPGNAGNNGPHGAIAGGGGQGGTQTTAGAGGAAGVLDFSPSPRPPQYGNAGAPGASRAGGAGAIGANPSGGYRTGAGGGGGGGYFGGGGGGSAADTGFYVGGGGGGGSSWIVSSAQNPVYETGTQSGDGKVVLYPVVVRSSPRVGTSDYANAPAIPDGLKYTSITGPDTTQDSSTCPVLVYGAHTYWPFSFLDNRVAMAIVAYDANGQVAGRWDKDGGRYIYQITIDSTARTVSFQGQHSMPGGGGAITMFWDDLWIG